MLMALTMVISNYFIPLGDNLKVFFTFLPKAVYCAIGGPLMGLAAGFVSDILGYMMHADGGFFPGYTLSTMLGCFTYALFLYRTKITFTRCLLSKVCVSLFVNIGLGSLWSQMMYGKGYLFYLGRSVIKNITLLPVEVLLMFAMFCALRPIAKRSR